MASCHISKFTRCSTTFSGLGSVRRVVKFEFYDVSYLFIDYNLLLAVIRKF